ncbi:AAA family ATPase [Luteitalea sp.]
MSGALALPTLAGMPSAVFEVCADGRYEMRVEKLATAIVGDVVRSARGCCALVTVFCGCAGVRALPGGRLLPDTRLDLHSLEERRRFAAALARLTSLTGDGKDDVFNWDQLLGLFVLEVLDRERRRDPASLRDDALEAQIIGDVLRHGATGLGRYDDAGLTVASFAEPTCRRVFGIASDVDADGIPVSTASVSARSAGAGVPSAEVARLAEGFDPPLAASELRESSARLEELRRAREVAALLTDGRERLEREPGSAPAILERLRDHTLPESGSSAAEWLDDVGVGTLAEQDDDLIAGLVPAAGFAASIGGPGSGKTFHAMAIALAVAAGHRRCLGRAVGRQGPVLYLAAEGRGHVADRVNAWKQWHGVPLDERLGVYFDTSVPALDNDVEVAALLPRVRRLRPALVVVDTLARHFAGKSENDSACMGAFVRGCDRLRLAAGGAVLVLHHPVKDTEGRPGVERGSGALRGAADAMFGLARLDDVVTVSCLKLKDGEEWAPFTLTMQPSLRSAVLDVAEDAGHVPRAAEVALRVLVDTFGKGGADGGEWASVLKEAPARLSQATFYRARTNLVEGGYVEFAGKRVVPTTRGVVLGQRLLMEREKTRENRAPKNGEVLTGDVVA